ncbi:MAG: tetratricopeptide repeat protein, partial [Isosphaeraceae bacterium]
PAAAPPKPRRAIRFGNLLVGLIPVFSGLALVGALLFQSTRPLQEHYDRQAGALMKAGRFAEAQACLKRLLTFDPDRDEVRYALGRAYDALGQVAQAREIMTALAPLGEKGYLPAHLWLAARLAAAGKVAPEAIKQAEAHFLVILKEYPKSPLIKRSLGMLYAEHGQPNKAIPYLLDVAENDPQVLLTIANCHARNGDAASAARYRREAVATSDKIVKENPKAPLAWLLSSQAAAASGDYAAAFAILTKGEEATKPNLFAKAKAALCDEWSMAVLKDAKRPESDRAAEALEIVWNGLTCEPENEPLSKTMSLLLMLGGENGDAVRKRVTALAEAKTPPDAAAVARLALGNASFTRNQPAEALRHWKLGYDLAPDLPILANNYAWALAFAGESDPTRALSIIEQSLRSRENDPRLRGTRGLILRRLGRIDDARADLELAIQGGNTHPEIKAALAGDPPGAKDPAPPDTPKS